MQNVGDRGRYIRVGKFLFTTTHTYFIGCSALNNYSFPFYTTLYEEATNICTNLKTVPSLNLSIIVL